MDGLKYSIKKQPKCVFDIDIEVAWEETNRELENIYNKIKTKVKISGFRKGKVPLDMIKSRYSEEAKVDLVDKFSPKILDEIFEKEKINPLTVPRLNNYDFKEGKPFKMNVIVEVAPEIQIKKYKKLKLIRKIFSVVSEDVDKTIENLRNNNIYLKTTESAASKGDFAVVEFKAFKGSKEINTGIPQPRLIEIGGNMELAGFDKNISGLKKGDKTNFKYTFDEKYPEKKLRNLEVDIRLKVLGVKEKKMPQVEELAESMGLKSVSELELNIKENLQKEAEKVAERDLEDQIIDILLESHDFEVPEGLVEKEHRENLDKTKSYVISQGGDTSKINESTLKEKVEKKIMAGMILSRIADKEDIKVTDEDKKKEEEKLMKIYRIDDREKVSKYVQEEIILIEKVFDFIKENSKIKSKKVKGGEK